MSEALNRTSWIKTRYEYVVNFPRSLLRVNQQVCITKSIQVIKLWRYGHVNITTMVYKKVNE